MRSVLPLAAGLGMLALQPGDPARWAAEAVPGVVAATAGTGLIAVTAAAGLACLGLGLVGLAARAIFGPQEGRRSAPTVDVRVKQPQAEQGGEDGADGADDGVAVHRVVSGGLPS